MDVAKRVIDLGFHPSTVYFPLVVEEAMMVEPTETETRETLDALAEAMLQAATEGGAHNQGTAILTNGDSYGTAPAHFTQRSIDVVPDPAYPIKPRILCALRVFPGWTFTAKTRRTRTVLVVAGAPCPPAGAHSFIANIPGVRFAHPRLSSLRPSRSL